LTKYLRSDISALLWSRMIELLVG